MPGFETIKFNMKNLQVTSRSKKMTTVSIDGRELVADNRFMGSLYSRYGFGKSVFNLFTVDEVFGRIADSRPDIDLKAVVELNSRGTLPTLLASSSPDVQHAGIAEVVDAFERFGCVDMSYERGIIRGRFVPESGIRTQFIGPDEFKNRYALDIPVDGFGSTKTYLEMLRLICSNGAVATSKAFTSIVKMGKEPITSLERVLGTFDDSQGFVRVQRKIETLQKSKLSMNEYSKFLTSITKSLAGVDESLLDGCIPEELMNVITGVTGDPVRIYNASPVSLSPKKQACLPMKCSVYDIFNIATEIETHYELDRRQYLREFVTSTLEVEPDLENTIKVLPTSIPAFYLPTTEMVA